MARSRGRCARPDSWRSGARPLHRHRGPRRRDRPTRARRHRRRRGLLGRDAAARAGEGACTLGLSPRSGWSAATRRGFRRQDRSCDAATIAFGIRNVAEPARRSPSWRACFEPGRPPGDPRVRSAAHSRHPDTVRVVFPVSAAAASAGWSRNTRAPTRTCRRPSARSRRPASFYKCCESSGFYRRFAPSLSPSASSISTLRRARRRLSGLRDLSIIS